MKAMLKRTILGIILFLIFYLTFFLQIFNLLVILILIGSIYECIEIFLKNKKIITLCYLFLVFIGLFSIMSLYQKNPKITFIIMITIILFDIFAYFSGKFFGKQQLCKISPKKTIEGVIYGGIITIILIFLLLNLFDQNLIDLLDNNYFHLNYLFILVVVIFLALFGDLLESYVKRKNKIKDSSNILKSHGGILDRVDSWMLVGIIINLLFI